MKFYLVPLKDDVKSLHLLDEHLMLTFHRGNWITWDEAQKLCIDSDAILATANSDYKLEILFGLVAVNKAFDMPVYIGKLLSVVCMT